MALDFSAASKQYKSLSDGKEQPSLIKVSIKMLLVMDPCVWDSSVLYLPCHGFNKNKEIILEGRTTSKLASSWIQKLPKLLCTPSLPWSWGLSIQPCLWAAQSWGTIDSALSPCSPPEAPAGKCLSSSLLLMGIPPFLLSPNSRM